MHSSTPPPDGPDAPGRRPPAPDLPLLHLDLLWLQVTGTLCNIACRHCFISCGPRARTHDLMTVEQCRAAIDTAATQGCRGYAFTGGEPFLHPDILDLVDLALAHGPLLVLSNGMLIDDRLAAELARRAEASPYSFDLRVSLDGLTAEENDPVRGRGVFDATCRGIGALVRAGLEPAVAVTTVHARHETAAGRRAFHDLLAELGIRRPRIKLIPPFRIGREARRSGGYQPWEYVSADMLDEDSPWVLQCGTSRMVTSRGAWPCPILVNDDSARMGDELTHALRPCRLAAAACHTCHVEGFTCRS